MRIERIRQNLRRNKWREWQRETRRGKKKGYRGKNRSRRNKRTKRRKRNERMWGQGKNETTGRGGRLGVRTGKRAWLQSVCFLPDLLETIVILEWTLLVAMPSWVSVDRAFELKVSFHFDMRCGERVLRCGEIVLRCGEIVLRWPEKVKDGRPSPFLLPPPLALPLLHLHGFYESVRKATHPHLPRPDFLFLSAVVDSITVLMSFKFQTLERECFAIAFKERVCFMMFLNLRLQQSVYVMCILAVKRSIAWGGELGGLWAIHVAIVLDHRSWRHWPQLACADWESDSF